MTQSTEDKAQQDKLNELARIFYRAQGYATPKGYDFSEARHPQERAMYQLACMAHDLLVEGLEAYDILDDYD